jgi:hypothetical protein
MRPRRRALLSATIALLLAALPPAPARAAQTLTARQILDRVDDAYRGDSAHGKMRMKVVTAHWTRELQIEFWSKGKEKSLARILSPLKEKGTATLKVDNDIWNFLPMVNRVIKVPSSMMGDSWMGSHFTNDDLVKESRFSDDFDFSTTFEGARDGKEVIEITCIPKADAVVVWGKVIVEVERQSYVALRARYFDEELAPAREMVFSQVRTLQGRTVPTVMTIVPADKPAESTTVSYDEIAFDLPLADELFSQRSLQR